LLRNAIPVATKGRVMAAAPRNPRLTGSAMLEVLRDAHEQAKNAAYKLRITGDPANHYAVMLYFTLIESAGSVLSLLKENRIAGVSAITRSALDAFVDIKNLIETPTHWRNLEAADAAQWKKTLEAASVPGNQYLTGLAQDSNFVQYRKEMKKRIKFASASGVKGLGVEARFVMASLNAEYHLYSFLSSDVHNNTSTLRYRHAKLVGDEVVLQLYSGRGAYSGSPLLTLSEMIMHSSEWLHEKFGTGKGSVRGIRAIVEEMQRVAMASKKARRERVNSRRSK
jgi:hypothetical protein